MSIRVGLDQLAAASEEYRYAYLLTVNDDGRPHAVAVTPELRDGALHATDLGRRTTANAIARPAISLVWPPSEPGGYSLIVDGDAEAADGGLAITPTTAVLHRPAPAGAEPSSTGCESDCVPIDVGTTSGSR